VKKKTTSKKSATSTSTAKAKASKGDHTLDASRELAEGGDATAHPKTDPR